MRLNRRDVLKAGVAASAAGLLPRSLPAADQRLEVAWINATVWDGLGDAVPGSALGTAGNRIVAVGGDAVAAGIGPKTRVVDLDGAFVMPGFIDNHTHFLRASQALSRPDLRQAKTPAAFRQMIGRSAAQLAEGQWVLGGNWDEQLWGGELPTRHWIDPVTGATPVAVVRSDQHMMLLNTVAMKLAGIDRHTPDPPGGLIVRDGQGEPTGIVKDAAKQLVLRVVPEPTDRDIEAAIAEGAEHGLGLGVTQVHVKALDWVTHDALRRMRARDETGMRFYSFVPLQDWERMHRLVAEEGRGDDWVRWGGMKGLVDGSLGSRTALFHDPYHDAPDESGITVTDPADLEEWILAADRAGLHLSVHAIGDLANEMLLDMYARTIAKNGPRDRRFLVEHAQHLEPSSVPRFAELGVIPAMQPYHAIDDGRWAVKRIGEERLDGTYAFRSLLEAGARLSFGSDWPVAPLDPRTGIEAAVLRRTIDGANPDGWLPGQKLAVEEALRAYTATNAYAGFQEDRLGRILPGFLADFVVLGANLFETDPTAIHEAPILRTVVDGVQRYGDGA